MKRPKRMLPQLPPPEAIRIADKEFPRVRYGEGKEDWDADEHPCRDCGVQKGQFHVLDCRIERCPACGEQLISCDCSGQGVLTNSQLDEIMSKITYNVNIVLGDGEPPRKPVKPSKIKREKSGPGESEGEK